MRSHESFARTAPPRLARRAVLIAAAAAVLAARPGAATDADDPIAPYLWTARPVVVFADAPQDPRLLRQLREFEDNAAALEDRDVVVIVDAEPPASRAEAGPLRARFRPHGFNVLVIGKDGQTKLRRPNVVTAAQLIRLIDRMPLRQQEMGRR
ncbi:MAG: DUF4174 domain-containing protein [Pseudomonadota bacterium]